ncbi:hypothetical protein AWV80_13865 [Cupriavidus sp. UYMU48A]|nr:hypothetical protein AWV80_13865 [Cupriavidus sp. UYMU48A]
MLNFSQFFFEHSKHSFRASNVPPFPATVIMGRSEYQLAGRREHSCEISYRSSHVCKIIQIIENLCDND